MTNDSPSPRKRGRPRKNASATGAENNSSKRLSRAVAPVVSLQVTDDWSGSVPISDLEIQLTATHLARVLDELFGPLP